MGLPLPKYEPIILATIYLTGVTYRLATKDFYDGTNNYFKGSLIEDPQLISQLSDLYYGVETSSSINLKFANRDNGLDDTWDKIVITNAKELRGRWIKIERYDPTDGTTFEFRGKITDYKLGSTVELTIEMRDDDILETLLPLKVVTTDEFTTTALDLGEPINICFGHCRSVPLRNIQNNTGANQYDYLIGYGTIESLWIDHANDIGIKRNGVLVNTSEYTFDDGTGAPTNHGYAGYASIRFAREQMDFTGNYHELTADVYGLELGEASAERNFARSIENILSNATWGLGDSIDAASFAAADAALDTIGNMYCDGAITEQRKARDIINNLLFPARARIWRAADGEWEIDIDNGGASVLNLGENDGYYNNCEVVKASAITSTEALQTATIHYSLDPSNEDTPLQELSVSVHSGFGVDRTYELPFVMENDTAIKILSYLKNRSIFSDKKVTINGGMECRDLSIGQIITLTSPIRVISAKEYMIENITKNLASFKLECREYNVAIYGDVSITPSTGPTGRNYVVYGPETWVGPISLGDGQTQSAQITMNIADGYGDIYIAAGKTDFTTTDNGFILGVDDSDSNKAKLYLGSATDYMYWDGSNLVLSGNITASSGAIGGWIISATALADNAIAANAKVYIDSANTLIRLGATTGNYLTLDGNNLRIRSSNYVSGMAGAGFTLEPDLLEIGNIAARGIIRTAVFQKDVVSAVGGNLAVLPADVLATDMTALDACHVIIEGNETFVVGDFLRIKTGDGLTGDGSSDDEWFEITGAAGTNYTVTRDMDAQYGAGANPPWPKGATVVNYRQSGDGFVYMTASETNAPYLGIITHAGVPWTTQTTRLRLGNLNGYLDYAADIYGFATGEQAASKVWIAVEQTNGIRIMNNVTQLAQWDTAGNISIGNTSDEHVYITSTAVQFKDGANVYTNLAAGVLQLGLVSGGEYVQVDSTGIEGYGNTVKLFELTSAGLAYLGDQSNEHIKLSSSGLQIYDGAILYATYGATTTIGLVASEHVSISATSVQFLDGANIYTDLTAGILQLGLVSGGEYVQIDSTGIEIYGNAVKNFEVTSAGLAYIGDQSNEHVKLSGTGVELKDGASVYGKFAATTTIGLVSGGEYVNIASTGITLYGGAAVHMSLASTGTFWAGDTTTTERIQWDTVNGLQLFNRVNAAYIKFPPAASATISGWTIGATTLANSTNIILDASNKRISIKNATFGNAGIQLQYNADSPQFYIGNGANEYFKYTTADGVAISTAKTDAITIKNGGNIKLDAGGDIELVGSNSDPGIIKFKGTSYNVEMGGDVDGNRFLIRPTVTGIIDLAIGSAATFFGSGSIARFHNISLIATNYVSLATYYNTTHLAYVVAESTASVGRVTLTAKDGATTYEVKFDGTAGAASLMPGLTNSIDLGTSSYKWRQGWFNDYVIAEGGIHVGGTSDPGIDTLLVDGSIYVGSATSGRITAGAGADLRLVFAVTANEVKSLNIVGNTYKDFGAAAFNVRCAKETKKEIQQLTDAQILQSLNELDETLIHSYKFKTPDEITVERLIGHNRGDRTFRGLVDIPNSIKSDEDEGVSLGEYCDFLLIKLKGLKQKNDLLEVRMMKIEDLL